MSTNAVLKDAYPLYLANQARFSKDRDALTA